MARILIEDGYSNLKSVVPAFGRYPAVTLEYRPALRADIEDYRFRLSKCDSGLATTQALVTFLAKHLKGWDVTDASDQPVPINEANLARVPDRILVRIFDIVTGYSETDQAVQEAKN